MFHIIDEGPRKTQIQILNSPRISETAMLSLYFDTKIS